jgi:thiamine-phosphate pyrophosphorylase
VATRLYLVTPPAFEPVTFADRLAEALDAGDVACVQLRLKPAGDDAIRRAADALRPIAQRRGVAFLMNDRPDLALATDCDGVHVGQEDASYAAARQIVGLGRIVGVTCHASRDLAIDAADAGADYVAFGAFFPSASKAAQHRAEPGIVQWWSELMTVPCVAIGGITPENCAPLVAAGADFLAVIAAVWEHPQGPGAAVKAFAKAIAAAG